MRFMTIRWLLYGLTVVALGCSRVLASAGTTTAFTLPAQSYPGSRERQYKVYAPGGLSGPAPMVMALHGCQQTHDDVLRDWGLVAAADRNGFILVTPFITSYDGLRSPNCWGFWLEQHRHQGAGESEDLHQIGLQVESRMSVDPTRRYVVGLSSGGAMAVVLSVTHNEYFAAAASAAGLPYGEDAGAVSSQCPGFAAFHTVGRVVADMRGERDNSSPIPLMVLQNNRDCTVVQPAGRHLRDAHLRINGDAAHNTSAKTRAQQRDCVPFYGAAWGCQHVIYTVDGQAGSRSLVETVFYDGPLATPDPTDADHAHYWVGGQDGRDGPWTVQRGPSYPVIVWDFFRRHRALAGSLQIPVPTCRAARTTPGNHIVQGHATAGGLAGLRSLSTGDTQDIGAAFNFVFPQVNLIEGTGGRWFVQRPAGCPG